MCSTETYKKCYINITEPAFYAGCTKEDSPYYMYSIKGYDPCFYFDFSTEVNIKFLIECRQVNEAGVVGLGDEKVGY
jgi:hypothetical protein